MKQFLAAKLRRNQDGVLDQIKRGVNIFVIGDLLIDHTVFVHEKLQHYPMEVSGELAFRVSHRKDTAGGAATTARAINSLADGTTFLWGLLGSSPWGSFRAVLEMSQALDGAKNRIEFRGVSDETDAPMTTISRLVAVHSTETGKERYERKARFADDGQIHIPITRQLAGLKYHLERIHRKSPLNCVVLNDLDLGALHHEVVSGLAMFAADNGIPLVVRARRGSPKYLEVQAKVLVCTLADWRLLTDASDNVEYWDHNIHNPEVADRFTRHSLGTFRNVEMFLVLVGDDWIDKVILIERPLTSTEPTQLRIEPGMDMGEKGKSQQVGASDVFAGALAFAIGGDNQSNPDISRAIDVARTVTQTYQQTGWAHVPRFDVVAENPIDAIHSKGPVISKPIGTSFLPTDGTIDLAKARTCVDGVYSVTNAMTAALTNLLNSVETDDKSIVLVASGGSGKSAIAARMIDAAANAGLDACTLANLGLKWSWNTPEKTVSSIRAKAGTRSSKRPFVVVDEVLKSKGAKHVATKGVVLLNEAQSAGIRFLLIDADFSKLDPDKLKSQFARRVSWHELPSAWERPKDIPYVFASCLHSASRIRQLQLSIDTSALVSIIEWMLRDKLNFGNLGSLAKDIMTKSTATDHLTVRWNDLPRVIRGRYEPQGDSKVESFGVIFE